ncbi:hypothetical protein FGO68_gene4705 [Halteria grandinella]|uniref:Uncharacterized protein n=1 Tax=Halteria grandinella TaxID=5974 RepID=A0A8J8NWM7_HALGN|nr:hypothetical protein FGO68_gene4705 [Halteria grandinella]
MCLETTPIQSPLQSLSPLFPTSPCKQPIYSSLLIPHSTNGRQVTMVPLHMHGMRVASQSNTPWGGKSQGCQLFATDKVHFMNKDLAHTAKDRLTGRKYICKTSIKVQISQRTTKPRVLQIHSILRIGEDLRSGTQRMERGGSGLI